MVDWSNGSHRVLESAETDASAGEVRWQASKSIWLTSMTLVALLAGPLLFSWSSFAVFLVLTGITLCAGHSLGMHRRLIHGSFECPLWLEHLLVYLGVLVGMAGPLGMMKQHDLRDWAQRKPRCHAYLCHRNSFWKDAFWQLHCDLVLDHPPSFQPEHRVTSSAFYFWLERTWMLQQIPLALVLFGFGGFAWLVWGVAARVSVSVIGHWLVGYFAHNTGPMRWRVRGAGVQAHDVPLAALFSMGESWHNNHHAYPGSAKLGLDPDQPDPGWWLLLALREVGLAWDLKTPENLPARDVLERLDTNAGGCPGCRALSGLRSV